MAFRYRFRSKQVSILGCQVVLLLRARFRAEKLWTFRSGGTRGNPRGRNGANGERKSFKKAIRAYAQAQRFWL
jgi:hypothetical protein